LKVSIRFASFHKFGNRCSEVEKVGTKTAEATFVKKKKSHRYRKINLNSHRPLMALQIPESGRKAEGKVSEDTEQGERRQDSDYLRPNGRIWQKHLLLHQIHVIKESQPNLDRGKCIFRKFGTCS
jgi:hypothetical protein